MLRRYGWRSFGAALALVLALGSAAGAQERAQHGNGRTAVFLDCRSRLCDFDHFRR